MGLSLFLFRVIGTNKREKIIFVLDKSEIRMKYNINLIVWMVGVVSLFVSCTRQTQMTSLLQQTDSLLYRHQSDSALQLLNTIRDENSLSGAQRMKFIWNKAMAHYQQEMSLLEDSQLYQSIAYYRRQKDTARLLDTYLLEGMYLRWKEANDEAIAVFDKGIDLAISRKDTTNMLVLQRKFLCYPSIYNSY